MVCMIEPSDPRIDKRASELNHTGLAGCEYIQKWLKLSWDGKTILTPEEVFNYSPTGELFMLYVWYRTAIAAELTYIDGLQNA